MKNKELITVLISIICIIVVSICAVLRIDELKKEINKKDQIIKTQKIRIEDLKIDCEWLQHFYNDFHEQVGAYE